MKFGRVDRPELVDFSLPPDHPDTKVALASGGDGLEIFVGCAKWNRQDLKNFYPRGTKDELTYYSQQFNSIELNSTFYNTPTSRQVATWKDKTPDGFKFFPKITNSISHFKRLIDVGPFVEEYCDAIVSFEEKLGAVFLQLHDNFKPADLFRVEKFIQEFPKAIPLAIEVRNKDWFQQTQAVGQFYELMKDGKVINILVDTAGRRDMLHMHLTTSEAFVRYVGANHPSDYSRLDEWVDRIKKWKSEGLTKLYFFVHQNIEEESPLLSAYFIKKLNDELGTNLHIPQTLNDNPLGL